MFIDSAGSWSHIHENVTITLNITVSGNSVNPAFSYMERGHILSSGSTSIDLKDPADPWFIHVESPKRLWCFDGRRNLFYRFVRDNSHKAWGTAISDGKLDPACPYVPVEVVLRLPAELRALFPAMESPAPIPGF